MIGGFVLGRLTICTSVERLFYSSEQERAQDVHKAFAATSPIFFFFFIPSDVNMSALTVMSSGMKKKRSELAV